MYFYTYVYSTQVDLCVVGAEGVMENGGIINKVENNIFAAVILLKLYLSNLSYVFFSTIAKIKKKRPAGNSMQYFYFI